MTRSLRHQVFTTSWKVAMVVLCVLPLSVQAHAIAAGMPAGPAESVPAAVASNTGTDDLASGPFQILASDDPDTNRNTTLVNHTDVSSTGGGLPEFNTRRIEAGYRPFPFDEYAWTTRQSRYLASRTDGYRRMLNGELYVAYADRWVSADAISNVTVFPTNEIDEDEDVDIGLPEEYHEAELSAEGTRYAKAEVPPRSGLVPVRNAHIYNPSAEPAYVTNPGAIEANRGRIMSYTDRNQQGTRVFTMSSAWRSRVPYGGAGLVPWLNRKPSVYYFSEFTGSDFLVGADIWTGIARLDPGARYNGDFNAPNGPVGATAPGDYRLHDLPLQTSVLPNDCTFLNQSWNIWRYENLNPQTAIVNHTVLNNGSPADSVTQPKQFTFTDPQSGTLTSRYTVHIRIERVYGEFSFCPNRNWEQTETVWRNVTVQSSANISVVPDSDASYIRLYAINRSWETGGYARNQLAVSMYTQNSFDARPFGNLVISHPDAGYRRIQGPWRFYPVRNYKGVRESSQGGSQFLPGSFAQPPPDDSVPHMYRDVAVPGTWDHSGQGMVWDITSHSTWPSIPPGDTPEGVVRYPGNTTDYFELIGVANLNGTQLGELEGEAKDVYGNSIPVFVDYREYQDVSVNFTEVSNSSYVRVCMTSRGAPVEHEPLQVYDEFELEGGTFVNHTTGDDGCFLIDKADEPVIHLTMEMSDWREGRNHYYEPVDEYYNNPDYWAQFATSTMQTVMELAATFMTQAFWAVLLLLFLWFKYTRPQ